MDDLFEMISRMAPEEALSKMTQIMESLMADLDQDARDRFLTNLIEQFQGDKVSSLVHL